jgi:hypothetical protein
MLKLSVSPGHEPGYIQRAATAIQPLPGVLRVRVDPTGHQLEIILTRPKACCALSIKHFGRLVAKLLPARRFNGESRGGSCHQSVTKSSFNRYQHAAG